MKLHKALDLLIISFLLDGKIAVSSIEEDTISIMIEGVMQKIPNHIFHITFRMSTENKFLNSSHTGISEILRIDTSNAPQLYNKLLSMSQ